MCSIFCQDGGPTVTDDLHPCSARSFFRSDNIIESCHDFVVHGGGLRTGGGDLVQLRSRSNHIILRCGAA